MRSRRARVVAGVAVAFLAIVTPATPAFAHAAYDRSRPADGERLDAAPHEISIDFTEIIAPTESESSITVVDACGDEHPGGDYRYLGKNMTASVDLARPGAVTVHWRVLDYQDGHRTFGSFAFEIAGDPSCAAPSPSPTRSSSSSASPSARPTGATSQGGSTTGPQLPGNASVPAGGGPVATAPVALVPGTARSTLVASTNAVGPDVADVAGGIITWIGLGLLVGIATLTLLGGSSVSRHLRIVAAIATLAGAAATAATLATTFHLPLTDFAATPLGRAACLRLGGALIAGAVILRSLRSGARPAARTLLGAGAVIAFGQAVGGHANIAAAPPLAITAQTIHILAISSWLGGVAVLRAATRGGPSPETTRIVHLFSRLAGFLIVTVAATGAIRAVDTVGSIGALTQTGYGQIVLLKIELLLLLAAFGARNRYVEVPRASRTLAGLRRFAGYEVIVALVALSATGFLRGTQPAEDAYRENEAIRLAAITSTAMTPPDGPTILTVRTAAAWTLQVYFDADTTGEGEVHMTFFGTDGRELPIRTLTTTVAGRATADQPRRFTPGHFTVALDAKGAFTLDLRAVTRAEGTLIALSVPFTAA